MGGQRSVRGAALAAIVTSCAVAPAAAAVPAAPTPTVETGVYRAERPRGVMATTGGWAYCKQARPIARRLRYTLICGTYWKDGYRGPGLRSKRHLEWGNPQYLAEFAQRIRALHRRVRGRLVLIGASYAGFGVAALASHHPELRPDRLVVVDAYLDLVARRRHARDNHATAIEIDRETGGSEAELRRRSPRVAGLTQLVRSGTRLTPVWTISDHERRLFGGATCDRTASAATLAALARTLGRPVPAWITRAKHGRTLWNRGAALVQGRIPGRRVVFIPGRGIPRGAVCE